MSYRPIKVKLGHMYMYSDNNVTNGHNNNIIILIKRGHKIMSYNYPNIYTIRLFDDGEITRKLSYRKDDRAMRRIWGCPENFRESLSTLTATFA